VNGQLKGTITAHEPDWRSLYIERTRRAYGTGAQRTTREVRDFRSGLLTDSIDEDSPGANRQWVYDTLGRLTMERFAGRRTGYRPGCAVPLFAHGSEQRQRLPHVDDRAL
jgi:YD repeat-containing protein